MESTIFSVLTSLMHHGFITVGLPYSYAGLVKMDEVTGGSPYGASTLAGPDGSRKPSENELAGGRFQERRHIAEITGALKRGALVANHLDAQYDRGDQLGRSLFWTIVESR